MVRRGVRRWLACAVLVCSAASVLAQQQKPPAVGRRTEPPTLPCAQPCAALPNAPSATSREGPPEGPPEPTPKPYSLLGPVASAPFAPLSTRQKFGIFLHHTYSPYTFVSAGLNATWAQIVGDLPGYGGGMQGWGKRFGEGIANTEARSFFGSFLIPSLTHEDPRYFPMREGGVFERFWYAGTRVLVTRKDDGGKSFNWSEVLGIAVSMALRNSYLPEANRGAWKTFNSFYGALGGDAGSLVLEEFWPDIKRFYNRHAPRSVKKIEQKLPPGVVGPPK